jgi:multiple sugar transport system substrate-binding protein
MLTNEVQIAYSQTEGYAPVTSKAQLSPEYQDYLSRAGEDNQLYYWPKIAATRLLMENTDNTFVTPVFNGSASLRNAAGQMIEEVNKSVRRRQNVDSKYLDKLFEEMTKLYRLDQIEATGNSGGVKLQFGELPPTAMGLLAGLGITWLGILAYVLWEWSKMKKM